MLKLAPVSVVSSSLSAVLRAKKVLKLAPVTVVSSSLSAATGSCKCCIEGCDFSSSKG